MKKPISIRSWGMQPEYVSTPVGHLAQCPKHTYQANWLSRPLCFGHRGAKGLAPENTLQSVKAALAAGVDWVEVDVWYVDGELVVIHDERVDRTTNGVGYVQDFRLHDLRMLDAGDCQRVPLLEEVISLIDGQCGLNIELKGPDCADAAVDAVQAALRAGRWRKEQFLLSSFDHAQLLRVSELDESIHTGLLVVGAPSNLVDYALAHRVWSVHFSADFVRAEWVAAVHEAGLWAFCYTVNCQRDFARCLAMGMDGVFTDYPDAYWQYLPSLAAVA